MPQEAKLSAAQASLSIIIQSAIASPEAARNLSVYMEEYAAWLDKSPRWSEMQPCANKGHTLLKPNGSPAATIHYLLLALVQLGGRGVASDVLKITKSQGWETNAARPKVMITAAAWKYPCYVTVENSVLCITEAGRSVVLSLKRDDEMKSKRGRGRPKSGTTG